MILVPRVEVGALLQVLAPGEEMGTWYIQFLGSGKRDVCCKLWLLKRGQGVWQKL